jgi:tetratricopeptide (TPR) repeat protein
MTTRLDCRCLCLLLCAVLGGAAPAWAAPYTPATDDTLVERLPLRLSREARDERQRALQHRNDLPRALNSARAAIERARVSGDPREFGQAQAALAPWWSLDSPPPAVRLLRATLRQSEHDFGAALADLDALLASADASLPVRAQAELTRASVWQVQGRYDEAHAGCARLAGPAYATLGRAVQMPAQVCMAEVGSLRGDVEGARASLAALAARGDDGQAGWLALVRAELAERQGDDTAARRLYGEALQAHDSLYALAAYADWLLDHARHDEVLALLEGRDAADALLLRRAIALHRVGDAGAPAAVAQLRERFDAVRERGSPGHAREEARYALDLLSDPARALTLAQANWALQKEPADARLLMRAAVAAGQPDAAMPVRRFIKDTGLADVRLAVLLNPQANGPITGPTTGQVHRPTGATPQTTIGRP